MIRSIPELESACSADLRASKMATALAGGPIPIFDWGWGPWRTVQDCPGDAVTKLEEFYRGRESHREMMGFVPCDLWRLVTNRTLWIVGDSQMQYFYRIIKMFLSPLADVERVDVNVTSDAGTLSAIEREIVADNCCGVAVPICTYLIGGGRVCHVRTNYAPHMIDVVFPGMHLLGARKEDIMVANFGLWHHKRDDNYGNLTRRWAEYVVTNASSLPGTTIWRDNTPQHFDIENGEFPHPDVAWEILKDAKGCVPIEGSQLDPSTGNLVGPNDHVAAGGWRNIISNPIIRDAGLPQLDTWNETVPLWNMHTANECTHWCAPGAHNVWVYDLWLLLGRLRVGPFVGEGEPVDLPPGGGPGVGSPAADLEGAAGTEPAASDHKSRPASSDGGRKARGSGPRPKKREAKRKPQTGS